MKLDIWVKLIADPTIVNKTKEGRHILLNPEFNFCIGEDIICLYEPTEVYTIHKIFNDKKQVVAFLKGDMKVSPMRNFHMDSILKLDTALKMFRIRNKKQITNINQRKGDTMSNLEVIKQLFENSPQGVTVEQMKEALQKNKPNTKSAPKMFLDEVKRRYKKDGKNIVEENGVFFLK